jgi:Ca2+ transporting ATPase
MAVTLSLAYSVKEMLKENNLVRRLAACETMGGADVICTDKTGTLTKNEMTLTHFYGHKLVRMQGEHFRKALPLQNAIPDPDDHSLFLEAVLCNTSSEDHTFSKASKTEIAVLEYLKKIQVNIFEFFENFSVQARYLFTSSRKRMSSVTTMKDRPARLYTKGGAEIILSSCSKFYNFETVQF